MIRLLATCLLLLVVADLLLLAQSSPTKKPPQPQRSNRNNTQSANGSAPVSVGQKSSSNSNRVRQVAFGMISREEWLAKEYFGYLCGEFLTFDADECVFVCANDNPYYHTMLTLSSCFSARQRRPLTDAFFPPVS
jgi:hypothetical protein